VKNNPESKNKAEREGKSGDESADLFPHPASDDNVVNGILLLGALENAFLHSPTSDQAVHSDLFGLPKAVCPIHRLCVNGRVPVVVVEDHRVRRCQIDAYIWKKITVSVIKFHD
jgi:hypothetical protein